MPTYLRAGQAAVTVGGRSPRTFGHGGSFGTVIRADPLRELICVLLTSQPVGSQGRHPALASNAVVSAATTADCGR